MSTRNIAAIFSTAENPTASKISIGVSELVGLTNANIDVSAGDWPSLVMAFLCRVHKQYVLLTSANEPNAISIQRTDQVITSGDWEGKQLTQFVVRAYTNITDTAPVASDVT